MVALTTTAHARLGLRIMRTLPASITDLPATELAGALGGPALFDLRKRDRAPLFMSVLLHGNETSGWDAVRQLAANIAEASVMLFVGNVDAARIGARSMPQRPDFNRVWEGGDTPEAAVAAEVIAIVAAAQPFLAVDVHNNTGDNPPYAVVTQTDRQTLSVARAFAPRALLTAQPKGFLSRRFTDFCTAVTVEVGMPEDPASTGRASAFLNRLLSTGLAPQDDPKDLALFESIARVLVTDSTVIDPALQRFNFCPAPAGTALIRSGRLLAEDAGGCDVSELFLELENGTAVLKQGIHIGMYTGDLESARQDCLCYLLQPFARRSHV